MSQLVETPPFPFGMGSIGSIFDSFNNAFSKFMEKRRCEAQRSVAAKNLLMQSEELLGMFIFVNENYDDYAEVVSHPQQERFMLWMLRDACTFTHAFLFMVQEERRFNSIQFKRLKKITKVYAELQTELDHKVSEKFSFDVASAEQVFLSKKPVLTPMRFLSVAEEDGGTLTTCFEIPQLYGYGETKQEAVEMLKREIFSMKQDLDEDEAVSIEYQYVKQILTHAI